MAPESPERTRTTGDASRPTRPAQNSSLTKRKEIPLPPIPTDLPPHGRGAPGFCGRVNVHEGTSPALVDSTQSPALGARQSDIAAARIQAEPFCWLGRELRAHLRVGRLVQEILAV